MKRTYNGPEQIAAAVKRYREGESVTVLAQFYHVAKPTVYTWIAADDERRVATPLTADDKFKRLEVQNRMLKAKVLDLPRP